MHSLTLRQFLDPIERSSEVLFGLIMVLAYTGSISVLESGEEDVHAVLVGAIGCNLAWAIVDAVMYLINTFAERARALMTSDGRRRTLASGDQPKALLHYDDYMAAAGVFLLVALSTFPVVVPFVVMNDAASALRVSQVVALVMLFLAGWSLGVYTGRPGWRTGVAMAVVGAILSVVTFALGG